MGDYRGKGGSGPTKWGRYVTQFSIEQFQIALRDWEGNWLVVHANKGMAYKYESSSQGGPLQGVVENDVGTGTRAGQARVQTQLFPDIHEERQRDEKLLQEAQEALPSSEAPKPRKRLKSSKSSKAKKVRKRGISSKAKK